MSMQEREYYRQAGHLGIGFDSFREEFLSTAINLDKIDEKELRQKAIESAIDEGFCQFEMIENKQKLADIFNISGGGNVTSIVPVLHIPCIVAGHIRGEYFKDREIKQENLYILLNYNVKYKQYTIKNPELSASAKQLLNSSGSEEFRRKYGDEFVIGFRTGAEYTALIETVLDDNNDKKKVYGELQAGIAAIIAITRVDTEIGIYSENQSSIKKYKVNALCYKRGSRETSNGVMLTLEEMLNDIKEFQKSVKEIGGIEYTALFSGYDMLLDVEKHHILNKELQELKYKINLLRAAKERCRKQLLWIENQLRFANLPSDNKIQNDVEEIDYRIYELECYIKQCVEFPNFIDSDEFNKKIKLANSFNRYLS